MPLIARAAPLLILLVACAALGAALIFQHVFGYVPCQMCLWQRWAYYVGIPLAAVLAAGGTRLPSGLVKAGLAVLLLVFAANAALGLYHAGVEWHFWPGPTSCGAGAAGPSTGSLIEDLKRTRVVACDAAPWHFLGLSFAGWNMVASAVVALMSGVGLLGRRPYGSSSVSQYR
ncbi:disulfide bond formation protein B [Terrihabitans rhizophilus]|uniref:Disulfide bond formation protein B n=1 Tax=Terrihabitans rhizophilus TaxID=3092662 RepID=A0ABU4RTQ9_9HYPH|nr:disulfide bond formation protein B [Terrihabitans sp. PJ23]MDX6807583.1 disulfide bond formation protein B [Terrihabitans sp. PJ23]